MCDNTSVSVVSSPNRALLRIAGAACRNRGQKRQTPSRRISASGVDRFIDVAGLFFVSSPEYSIIPCGTPTQRVPSKRIPA